MSGRNPPSYCTLTLIAMQGHQQKGRQNNTSSNNKDKSNTIIETSTAEDHDDVVVVVVVFTLKLLLTSIQYLLFLTLQGKATNYRGHKLTQSKVQNDKIK